MDDDTEMLNYKMKKKLSEDLKRRFSWRDERGVRVVVVEEVLP